MYELKIDTFTSTENVSPFRILESIVHDPSPNFQSYEDQSVFSSKKRGWGERRRMFL